MSIRACVGRREQKTAKAKTRLETTVPLRNVKCSSKSALMHVGMPEAYGNNPAKRGAFIQREKDTGRVQSKAFSVLLICNH
jgi:hypothetical protein